MKVRKEASGLFKISLERGDEVNSCIERVAEEYDIHGATVRAIGAIENPELGYYRLRERTYIRDEFPGIWELSPLIGNISMKDGKPFLHAHVTIGGPDFIARCGHLFTGKTGVVVEVEMMPGEPMIRLMCDDIGLHRWEPDEKAKPE